MSTTLYQIRVKGQLDSYLSAWFLDFTLAHTPDGNTVMVGNIVDQAALHGILARCRDLGVTLISVNPLTENEESTGKSS